MNPGMSFTRGNVYDMPFSEKSFDMVMLCEVLEHLHEPEKALAESGRISRRYCIFSVPREPLFMLSDLLRGKNILRLGNDEEHVNHWTDKGFREFISPYFDIIEVRRPFPWTVVLCEKKRIQDVA